MFVVNPGSILIKFRTSKDVALGKILEPWLLFRGKRLVSKTNLINKPLEKATVASLRALYTRKLRVNRRTLTKFVR